MVAGGRYAGTVISLRDQVDVGGVDGELDGLNNLMLTVVHK